jgi:long-chain acyl-CoA synthetase
MVTDRKKEIFKLSNGKFIAPQLIENLFKESALIDQIMVVGEHEKFASALISPDFQYLDEWQTKNKIPFSDHLELIKLPEIMSIFSSEIETFNKRLNPVERLSRFRLVPDEWSPATGELSPTLKLKRQFIADKYREIIDQIYMK